MTFSRRTLSILTAFLVVGLLGGGIYWRLRPAGEAAGEAQAAEGGEAGDSVVVSTAAFSTSVPQAVGGAEVVRDTLWIRVRGAAVAQAFRRATVKAQVEGVIQGIPVRENRAVGSGQAILQIDTTELAMAVAQARSDLLNAEADYQGTILFDDRIEDPEVRRQREQVARARSGLNGAEVALRRAEIDLARSTVRAPFEGRVADLLVVPGQHVAAGTDLMTIVDLDPIKVEVEVLEAELPVLREGRRAEVTFAGLPGETFEGRIETINPVVDPSTRTGRVTVLLRNPEHRIKPGMYAEADLEARSFPDRILVPREAVLERGDDRRTMVFVLRHANGRQEAYWQYVFTGRENDRLVEILESEEGMVQPGDTVLVEGHHYLAHQTPVRIVDNPAVEGGRPSR